MSNEHLISKNIIQEYDDHSGDLFIGIEYFMHLKILFQIYIYIYIYCGYLRHAWQHPRHSSNVLGRPRHALQRPWLTSACFATSSACFATSLVDLGMLCNLDVSHRKKTSPTFCLISCETKGVVYHQASLRNIFSFFRNNRVICSPFKVINIKEF